MANNKPYWVSTNPIKTIAEFYNKNEAKNKGSLLKVYFDAFSIGKVRFSFAECDANMKRLSNQKTDFYLDIDKALVLAEDITRNKLTKDILEEQKKNPKYTNPVRDFPSGVNAEKAKERGIRKDGKPECVRLKISASILKDCDVCIMYESGPGKMVENGLIAPDYSFGKAEKIIRIGAKWEEVRAMALQIKVQWQAYATSCAVMDAIAHEKFVRQQQKGNNKNAG